MVFKKRVIFLVMFVLLSVNVFAQSFGFDFGFGGGRASGFSNIISSTLDLIFGGVIRPIFDYVNFSNFTVAVKLALWIVLFMLFSTIFKGYFKNMPTKFSKVIAAIIAFFGVAFIPEQLLQVLFRDFLSGAVGYLLFFAFIFFPLYWLHKWSKDSDDRAVNLVAAAGFFLMMLFISYLDGQVLYSFNYGIMQNLASLTIALGVMGSLILFIHRLARGLRGVGGEEGSPVRPVRGEIEERDEFENEKSSAQRLIGIANELRQHIQNVSDVPETLARELLRRPDRLDFVNIPSIHNLHSGITHLADRLSKAKKNKQKTKEIVAQIIDKYNGLHDSLEAFRQLRRRLTHYLAQVEAALHARTLPNYNYFGDLIGRLRIIDRNLRDLVAVLSRVETL